MSLFLHVHGVGELWERERAFATLSVEAELEVFPPSHPTLTGAALRLVLQEQPGGA
ncbi:hypothetical protein [Streptomyces sp. C10-9-1]|uniref:hypothetical protein n=1 Tax=Streptomyces sp. C10-9-1 TaxID=1859285 RepID=UPI003D762DE5